MVVTSKCFSTRNPPTHLTSLKHHRADLPSFPSYEAYEPEEPHYDDEEPLYDGTGGDPDDPENSHNRAGAVNGDDHNEDLDKGPNGIVEVGQDASAARGGKKAAVVGLKEKKIPKEERSTTPYMTKYERARVLGTRALQIR